MSSTTLNTENQHILRVVDFGVTANDRRLLTGVNLSIGAGDIVGLTGPSGCGKTTLLRAMAGLIDPASGEIYFQGQSPDSLGWPAFRRMVSYLDQTPVMLNGTVEENLRKPFSYMASKGEYPAARAAGLFERVLIEGDVLSKNARQLSVGEMQRVNLVRTLLVEPRVLLLDEPTSALDPDARQAVERLIADTVKERSMAAVIVTHDREQTRRICMVQHDVQHWLAGGASGRSHSGGGGPDG